MYKFSKNKNLIAWWESIKREARSQVFTLTQPTRFDRKDKIDNDKEDLSNHSTCLPILIIIVLRAKQTTLE